MIEPTVSVIMPAFNAEKFIGASIESVIAQTYSQWELIVVDDGSRDKTSDIVNGFASSDKRIKYYFQNNKKLARARNAGIRHSTGQLVAFLDSDDLWLEDKLRLQVKTLLETNSDLVFSDGFMFSDDNVTDETFSFTTIAGKFVGPEWYDVLIKRNRIPVLSVLVRRDVLDQVDCFDENPDYYGVEDYELWLRIAKRGFVFYGMKEKLVRYRIHEDGMTRNRALMFKSEVAVLEKHLRGSTVNRERIKYMRERAAMAYLDEYFLTARSGQLSQAMGFLRKSIQMEPRVFMHFRRFGAVLKNAALSLLVGIKRPVR